MARSGATHDDRHGEAPDRARHAHAHDHHGHDHHDPESSEGAHHHHDHAEELRNTPIRRLIAALAITAAFMFVEAIVGWLSKSLALVADAGHMLADAAALALAIGAQKIAAQQRTRTRTYGF